jgi:ribonucleoside-triphosphate reductase
MLKESQAKKIQFLDFDQGIRSGSEAGPVMSRSARLFRYVEKRSKEIEEFHPEKIGAAIFRAATSVGGKDRHLARRLADKVCRHLYEQKGEHVLSAEEIQDSVEKVLIEEGHVRTAKAFILHRERMNLVRRRKALRGKAADGLRFTADGLERREKGEGRREKGENAEGGGTEATDFALFVRTSEDGIVAWNRERIVASLTKETNLSREVAESIGQDVEEVILGSNVKHVTASLIREIVNAKLVEQGLEGHREQNARLGLPLFDVEKILTFKNKENSNTPHTPEGTNLTLAESINKQFALARVFDSEVADAHTRGDIHLHDLGFICRPYCSGQSLEYIKKFGLTLPNAISNARPAKHPETLLAHMVKFSAALQGHFAGAIGWDAVNIFFAPFLTGMSDQELHQIAQMLIFEYSQQNVARGGQSIFSDINLYWEIPEHFVNTAAMGPGGKMTGKKYGDYQQGAQRFVRAIFDIYGQGDGSGRPFFFPKPLVHITERFFQTEGWQDFLYHISDVAAEKGNTYFVFDRGKTAKISECCRLSFQLDESDLNDARQPWKMRYCAMQNVTINLPRIAYVSNRDTETLFENVRKSVVLAVKAHLEKKAFLEKLLALKEEGPLALLTMSHDGESYLRMRRVTYLVGMLGLNEMVQYHAGKELHEDVLAYKLGLRIVAELRAECRRQSAEHGMRFLLEQTPAESTAYRMAKLDLQFHPEAALETVKGGLEDGSVYYTNSTYLNVGLPIDPIERVYKEGKFHDMIEAGALTHIWMADARPPKETIANFVLKTFHNSRNAQIAFSPEFTSCNSCLRTARGLHDTCPYCGADGVEFITRVTGYFSKVSGWNRGKRSELKDRYKKAFDVNLFTPRS